MIEENNESLAPLTSAFILIGVILWAFYAFFPTDETPYNPKVFAQEKLTLIHALSRHTDSKVVNQFLIDECNSLQVAPEWTRFVATSDLEEVVKLCIETQSDKV